MLHYAYSKQMLRLLRLQHEGCADVDHRCTMTRPEAIVLIEPRLLSDREEIHRTGQIRTRSASIRKSDLSSCFQDTQALTDVAAWFLW